MGTRRGEKLLLASFPFFARSFIFSLHARRTLWTKKKNRVSSISLSTLWKPNRRYAIWQRYQFYIAFLFAFQPFGVICTFAQFQWKLISFLNFFYELIKKILTFSIARFLWSACLSLQVLHIAEKNNQTKKYKNNTALFILPLLKSRPFSQILCPGGN